MKRLLPALLVLALPVSAFATSDTTPPASPGSVVHDVQPGMAGSDDMAAEMQKMAMGIELTGDPDIDFARSMIVHHEGAIAMAETLLEQGKDPELRALAEDVIEAQQGEIEFLSGWLEQNAQ